MLAAGEASGDLHGSNLVKAVSRIDPSVRFYGMGGERLKSAGMELLFDLEHMAVMGVSEVFSGLGRVLSTLRALKKSLKEERPSALVLIDYPDFNLMLAKAAYKLGIPVFYYICPQIWAWRTGRIKKMEKYVERRVVVFPFEVDFYKKHGVQADFVGHPLLDIMEKPKSKWDAKAELGLDDDRKTLLLMPGSRKHVVDVLLPTMLEAAEILIREDGDLSVILAQADTMSRDYLESFTSKWNFDVNIVNGKSHLLQNAADAALVASGTSTLETALMATPMVVIYKLSRFSFMLGKLLVSTEHVAMANLIAGDRVVPELLQDAAEPRAIASELKSMLYDPAVNEKIISGLSSIRRRLGEPGASGRAAELLLDMISG